MSRSVRAILALGLLGAATFAYVALRPTHPWTGLIEFPIAVVLVAFLCYQAAKRPRPRPVAQSPALRRHEQVVRPLPDPEAAALERALAAWVQTGARPEVAADILARAHAADAPRREAARARLLPLLAQAGSRRERARLVQRSLQELQP